MGGGGGSFELGRPAEVRPVTFEMGVNIYSGPQASLAGSLPSWVSWFSANLEYELGALVHFDGLVNVYKHSSREDYITQVEYDLLDDTTGYDIVSGASIVKRSLFSTELQGNKLGSTIPIGDNLKSIMTYFDYIPEKIFVCTEDGAKMSASDFNDPSTRKSKGFWSLAELGLSGWNIGFKSSKANDPNSALDVNYKQIILNLTDITAGVVGVGDPNVVACNAILVPPSDPSNYSQPNIKSRVDAKRRGFGSSVNDPGTSGSDIIELGVCEIKLIPTDKISFGGGIVRTPVSRAEMAAQEGTTYAGEDHTYVLDKELSVFHNASNSDNPWKNLVENKTSPMVDPRYGEASNSLNAFLASVYFHAFPQGGMATTQYWVKERSYIEGETVRFAYHAADEGETNVLNKTKKDCMWICRESHTSSISNKPPLMGDVAESDNSSQAVSVLSNQYWQPYSRLINQPNSSLGELHDIYKSSGQLLQKPIAGTGTSTVSNETVSSPRKRMSDLIGGSKLYGHLTMGPMGAKTRTRIDYKCRRRRCSAGYIYLPPTGSNPEPSYTTSLGGVSDGWNLKYLGGMDLWLFPNNFKKDHGGQIKYAVGFYDHISYNIETAWGTKRKSWFRRLIASIFGGRKGYDWSTVEKFSRSHFQTLTNAVELDIDNKTSVDYSKNSSSKQSSTDNSGLQENDIIRFAFRYLTGFCDQRDVRGHLAANGIPNGHYYVSGYYEVVIQDLNSGNVLKPNFRYLDLMSVPADNRKDSFERSWSPNNRGTYDNELWKEYMNAADDVAKKFQWTTLSTGSASQVQSVIASTKPSPATSTDLKLITTRNWYNWLILGSSAPMANALSASDYYHPLIIKSMDVPESVFKSLCGMVQTGFRNMDFGQIQNSDSGTLDFSLPSAFQELASGATLPSSVELDGPDMGAFTTSKNINEMPDSFISSLKSTSVDLSTDQNTRQNTIYQPGQVVKYQNKFYYIKEEVDGQTLFGLI